MFSNAGKGIMLAALGVEADLISLHTGDPGSAGTSNEVTGGGYSRQAATWAAPSAGEMALGAAVDFSGPANEDATWFAIWHDDTVDVFLGRGMITGDTEFNSTGEFRLATGTTLSIIDPS